MDKSVAKIDRYPGKMVAHLAERLMERYGSDAESLFDPYCGSSAILKAAKDYGVRRIAGLDINPYANLLSDVKLNGFYPEIATQKFQQLKDNIRSIEFSLPIEWDMKNYWFTPATLKKYELLRGAAYELDLSKTKAGRAILLALALSVRPCSLADQRSPKPFISKNAIKTRRGKHFDPIKKTEEILYQLCETYGKMQKNKAVLLCKNIVASNDIAAIGDSFTHVMTSPPYINAQDYFRNWKLELYILEDLLPFKVKSLRNNFIGTERGNLLEYVIDEEIENHHELTPQLRKLNKRNKRLAAIVHRYLSDMNKSVANINRLLVRNGKLVMVCGDNLVGNLKFKTSIILEKMIVANGFTLIDMFADKIKSRQLPPKRHGHKGLIKEEIIFAFEKNN